MRQIYCATPPSDPPLTSELLTIARSGFTASNGCFIITYFSDIDTNVSAEDFPDATGYECFLNSINIDDYVDDHYLSQGILFVEEVFNAWRQANSKQPLVANMVLDEIGLKVKFHMQRDGEQWLDSDLEEYEDGVMIVTSDEPRLDTHDGSAGGDARP
ncbi:MAG: hypothetical protein Tsb0020_24900 [Haliangiales bacterium]